MREVHLRLSGELETKLQREKEKKWANRQVWENHMEEKEDGKEMKDESINRMKQIYGD